MELIQEGDPNPTAERVAKRAGLSPRLVFHHFRDQESLMLETAAYHGGRIAERLTAIDPALPVAERVAQLVKQRDALYEFIAPFRRAAMLREPRMPLVAAALGELRRYKREQAVALFAGELDRAEPAARRLAAAQIALATSFSAWEELRTRQGLKPAASRAVMAASIEGALATAGGPRADGEAAPRRRGRDPS